jgi:hypothetical protein
MLCPPESEGDRSRGFLIDFDYAFILRHILGLDDFNGAEDEDADGVTQNQSQDILLHRTVCAPVRKI